MCRRWTEDRQDEAWGKERGEAGPIANSVQTTDFFWVKSGLSVDGVERMKDNAEIIHYAIQNELVD